MGHGWGSHGGTWKMSAWGQNINPEMLHVLGAWVAWASKRMLGRPPKRDMFWWVVSFEAHVLWCAVFNQLKQASSHLKASNSFKTCC
jgi:hypothetical protein